MAGKILVRKLISILGYELAPGAESNLKAFKDKATQAAKSVNDTWRDANGKLRDARGRFAGVGQGAGAASAATDGASAAMKRFGKAAHKHLGQAHHQASMLKDMLVSMAIGMVVMGVINGIGQLISSLVTTNVEAEKLRVRMTTLLGPEKATAKFKELEKFAARTPFQLDEITDAFLRLEAAGFDMSEENMTALGDLAASSNKSFHDVAEILISSGRGLGNMVDNFNGLAAVTRGGKLEMTRLDKETGKVFKKIVDPKNKKELMAFFAEAGKAKGVKDGMERLSQTTGGLFSTLKDNVAGAFRAIGDAGLTEGMRELLTVLNEDTPGATSAARVLGRVLGGAIKDIAAGVRWLKANVAPALAPMARYVRDNAQELRQLAKMVAILALPMGWLILLIEDFYVYLTGGDSAIGAFIARLKEAGIDLSGLKDRVWELVAGIKGVAQQVAAAWRGDQVEGPIGKVVGILRALFDFIVSDGPAVFRFLLAVARPVFQNVRVLVERFASIAMRLFSAIGRVAFPLFRILWAIAKPVLKLLMIWFGLVGMVALFIWGLIGKALLNAFDFFVSLIEVIAKVAGTWLELWVPVFETIWGWIEKLIDGFMELLGIDLSGLNNVLGKIDGLFSPDNPASPQGARNTAAQAAAARGGQGGGGNTATVTVGQVVVQGSTNMGPKELAGAVADGGGRIADRGLKGLARKGEGT